LGGKNKRREMPKGYEFSQKVPWGPGKQKNGGPTNAENKKRRPTQNAKKRDARKLDKKWGVIDRKKKQQQTFRKGFVTHETKPLGEGKKKRENKGGRKFCKGGGVEIEKSGVYGGENNRLKGKTKSGGRRKQQSQKQRRKRG